MNTSSNWRLGLRAYPRHKIFQPARLATCDGWARIHMLDVSSGGVRIHSPSPLEVGAQVSLAWGDHKRTAEVAWSYETKAGLRFNAPLTAGQMTALLAAA